MDDASRSELSNPGLRGPNAKRATGPPVCPYTARSASLRGRPPLTTSDAGRRSAHIRASEPKCANLVIRATPVASPRELSNPTQSTTRALASPQHAPQVLALAPLALGFAPAAQTRAPTALHGYVPKGLTEAQYKAQLAAEKSKAQSNKSKFPKGKKTLDIADWLVQMEKKQTLKGDKVVGSGHSYAKQKFSTKSAFDKVFGTNKEMWE